MRGVSECAEGGKERVAGSGGGEGELDTGDPRAADGGRGGLPSPAGPASPPSPGDCSAEAGAGALDAPGALSSGSRRLSAADPPASSLDALPISG